MSVSGETVPSAWSWERVTHSPAPGRRRCWKACRICRQPSAAFKNRARPTPSDEAGSSASSACATVTSRSTRVMRAASVSRRWRPPMPQRPGLQEGKRAGHSGDGERAQPGVGRVGCLVAGCAPERLLDRVKPHVELPLENFRGEASLLQWSWSGQCRPSPCRMPSRGPRCYAGARRGMYLRDPRARRCHIERQRAAGQRWLCPPRFLQLCNPGPNDCPQASASLGRNPPPRRTRVIDV
jgi:hypothetical protein